MAYSEDRISDALTVLAANGGNVARTRRDLESAGWKRVPARKTLAKWRTRQRRPTTKREHGYGEKAHQKKARLAAQLEELAWKITDALDDEAKIEEASILDLTKVLGILVDKFLALTEATEADTVVNVGVRTNFFDEIRERYELDERTTSTRTNGTEIDEK